MNYRVVLKIIIVNDQNIEGKGKNGVEMFE